MPTSSSSARTTGPPRATSRRSAPRQTLLDGGPAAVAIAPANYRSDRTPRIRTIGVLAAPGDDAAIETARELAEAVGASAHS